jgi:hypothetical protein
MKPIFAKEAGRWANSNDDYECYGFNIKYENSEKWHSLIIKVKKEIAIGYSIDHNVTEGCDEQLWVDALLKTADRGNYRESRPKEFVLCKEKDECWYALTENTKQQMQKETVIGKFHKQPCPNGFWVMLPNLEPGPKFKDEEPQLRSGLSM